MHKVRFSTTEPRCDRRHYLSEDDVRVVLSRLPCETWERLKAVHFNDRSDGVRTLGYVTRGHREISICALPPKVSLTRFLRRRYRQTPGLFGAVRGRQWPVLAVRRFLLYDVFLHELGHIQVVDPWQKDPRRRFAGDHLAQEFVHRWRKTLWARRFDHPDPVHRRPSREELAALAEEPRKEDARP